MGHALSTVFLLEQMDKMKKNGNRVYYSPEEIAKHNSKESLWIVSNKKVYDITSFANFQVHPGGIDALKSRAGGEEDCKKDYNFHSKKTQKRWTNYFIGYVKEDNEN